MKLQNYYYTRSQFAAVLQVLDDSTCAATRQLVDDKVMEWRERGVCVTCLRRTNRQGYKAGALKEVGLQLLHEHEKAASQLLTVYLTLWSRARYCAHLLRCILLYICLLNHEKLIRRLDHSLIIWYSLRKFLQAIATTNAFQSKI